MHHRGRLAVTTFADRLATMSPVRRRVAATSRMEVTPAAALALWPEVGCRLFPGLGPGVAISELRSRLPDHCRSLVSRAGALSSGRFDLLGYGELSFGEPVDWHLDPVAGTRVPLVHWSGIDPLDPSSVGDSKVIWELNRHQWLVTLAQAYCLTDDARYAREVAESIGEWIDANPPGLGINWTSSLEVSLRLMAWCWALGGLHVGPVLSAGETRAILGSIEAHASYVARHLSHYFAPNTHLTGEALGLFYAGTLFPELPDAASWRDTGRRILIDECRRQVHEDGVYFEQATCYQRYTAEIYLHFVLLSERHHRPVPVEVRERLERLLEFLLSVQRPNRTMPAIGDADGGWLLPVTRRKANDCRGVFGLAAAWSGRSDFAWAAEGLSPEVLWILGADGARRFDSIRPVPPLGGSRLFPAGGYAVLRTGWDRDAHQMIVDVGPIGGLLAGGHGHADLLALQCSAFGDEYLGDSGTGCYTAGPIWRNYFRSSAAHSTVTVDGVSQAEPRGPFGWASRPVTHIRSWRTTVDCDFLDAHHDGYARLADSVRHRRRVLFVKPNYWVVIDDLDGRAVHRLDLRFQAGTNPVIAGPDTWTAISNGRGAGLWVAPFSDAPIVRSLKRAETNPIEGWTSPDYGVQREASTIVYTMQTPLPVRVITVVWPVRRLRVSPPAVQTLRGPDGRLGGLLLMDTDDAIEVDDQNLVLRRVATSAEETFR